MIVINNIKCRSFAPTRTGLSAPLAACLDVKKRRMDLFTGDGAVVLSKVLFRTGGN